MTEEKKQQEEIAKFLEGLDDQKYITAIEGDYYNNEVTLIIDDPEKGKRIETKKYTPHLFIKDFKKLNKPFFGGDRNALNAAIKKHGITFKKLRTDEQPRLEYGYKYLVETSKKAFNLNQFFKEGGLATFGMEATSTLSYKNTEQFLMSTGKRLFKGIDKYSDIHKVYFDIETTSLTHEDGRIFLIGIKDNRGFRKVLSIDQNNPDESEREMIIDFFNIIMKLKPVIVAGYNSEAFDFYYILGRAATLGIDFGSKDIDGHMEYDVRSSYNPDKPITRRAATVKFGGESEKYEKTIMWGLNVIDIAHAVRAAKAINSDIKGWGLKYITQYIKANKPNRMYVPGDKIYKIWDENKKYFINKSNYQYKLIPNNFQDKPDEYIPKLQNWVNVVNNTEDKESLNGAILKVHEFFDGNVDNIGIISGSEIIYQYLLDDLDETETVDESFGQANFMIGKIMPTDYVRATTMGNSSKWKMLLTTYSYLKKLAIPVNDKKRDIVGGLSRLLVCGYAKNVLKMDFSSLYPSIQLTHDVFPDFDITNVIKNMLAYFRDSRNENKALSKKYKKSYEETKNQEDLLLYELYDTKQLPIKILGNSGFGAISAPDIFNWGDNNIGEEITSTGRQYLRSMVHHFGKYGFKALVGDSVTHDTPVYLKDGKGNLHIIAINELFNEKSEYLDSDKQRDYEEKPYEILTVNGWKSIKYVYRHDTTKNIHRVVTKDRLIQVTEDHSLFQDEVEIKPSTLNKGDKIDITNNLDIFNKLGDNKLSEAFNMGTELIHTNLNKIPYEILNSSIDVKKEYIRGLYRSVNASTNSIVTFHLESQVVVAGIVNILKELNYNYSLELFGGGKVLLNVNINGDDTSLRKSDRVWYNKTIKNEDKNGYVYDISTEDGTFIGGIGMINCKNTDGFNFSMPDEYEKITYNSPKDNKTYTGYEAVLAEYNDLYMTGVMKLSLDGLYTATVNLKRKNYIDLNTDGTIKLVGNSIKSSAMPKYIEESIDKMVVLLANNKSKEFVEEYYSKLEMIYNQQVPLIKIASKSKVKEKVADYVKDQKTKKNKNGNKIPKKAHMELLIEAGLDPDLGTNIYYVNNGTAKSHSDVGHSYLVMEEDFISDPDRLGEYNYKRAVNAFNKKMEIFMMCFSKEVRETLLVNNPKDRAFYTDEELKLVSGQPLASDEQDCLTIDDYNESMKNEPLMEMSEREICFWNRSGKNPYNIFPHFTTQLSRTPLLTQEEHIIKNEQEKLIKEFFFNKGIEVKSELEYIMDGDLVIKYHNIFVRKVKELNEKTGKEVEKKVEDVLPKMSWILVKDKSGYREDLKVIDEHVYSRVEIKE